MKNHEQEKETIEAEETGNHGDGQSRPTTAPTTAKAVIGLTVILALAYLFNSPILVMLYPKVSEDYYQYVEFVSVRANVYECMFFLFFTVVYLQSKRLVKSLSCSMMILTAGSVVDKLIFGFKGYLYTDLILIAVAIVISIKVYVRENRRGG